MHSINVYVPAQSYISINIYTDGKFRYGAVGFVCVWCISLADWAAVFF